MGRQSRCCKDHNMACFEKDDKWAHCQTQCVPGKHASDPKEYQTPWSCRILRQDGTALPYASGLHVMTRGVVCLDEPEWSDASGDNCSFYAKGNNCADFGHGYAPSGRDAVHACCVCGGGRRHEHEMFLK